MPGANENLSQSKIDRQILRCRVNKCDKKCEVLLDSYASFSNWKPDTKGNHQHWIAALIGYNKAEHKHGDDAIESYHNIEDVMAAKCAHTSNRFNLLPCERNQSFQKEI